MVKGLLADANIIGPVRALAQRMQAEPWTDLWGLLGLSLFTFDDVGLIPKSKDVDVWTTCQDNQLILITDNRNSKTVDSMEATIRTFNQPDSLPIFTISDMDTFQDDREYADRVVENLYDYLMRIDDVRGTGRLYLP
jgi:hypothetical protein